ncbi:MAG: FAD-dependent oxidoreductase [Bryobacteraceae bacterium]
MRTSSILLSLLACACALPAQTEYDLIVYGGTAGGVMAAVTGAREGLHVLLLEPGHHLGGMATGGLSRTDVGKREVIGGDALEFYWRLGLKYDIGRFAQDVAWFYEPHAGEEVLREMLHEVHVTVLFGHRLRGREGVEKRGLEIVSLTTENGARYTARIFADCSYEGDLMGQAGVSYTWGRESTTQYRENLAGVQQLSPGHQFPVKISARDEQGRLLPEIHAGAKGTPGSGDKKVQSYNFRLILSDDPANQAAFPKPPGYDPHRYELLARLLEAMTKKLGRAPVLNEVSLIAPIPNHKADFNNKGAFSTDYIGASWEYPTASYARRQQIWRAHIDYTQGFFYFLAHDPRVPKPLQAEMNRWGLAKDEFRDTENWPNQLYIREGRRMTGDFVMTQKDLQTELTKPDPIGMGSYNSDSHNVQRIVTPEGYVEDEGDVEVGVKPYQIPYRVMLPKRTEISNLLVPICLSASHVAYSSLRMEPQYMIIGQAAGVAAALAIREHQPVQQIDTRQLTDRLKAQGALMEYRPSAVPQSFYRGLWQRFHPGVSRERQLPF